MYWHFLQALHMYVIGLCAMTSIPTSECARRQWHMEEEDGRERHSHMFYPRMMMRIAKREEGIQK
jgi:hypothetical protein